MTIQVLDDDVDVFDDDHHHHHRHHGYNDHDHDNHGKTGVEVVGRLAAQGVDEETLKALVFIHGAAQVEFR